MALPGLVAANNLSDVVDRERAWDNLGLNISATWEKLQNLDPDASAYIDAVALVEDVYTEPGVQRAINDFIIGCKADGIWSAIKASCILAGARTLTGALVPLVGTAPTNNNFVSGDYNRKTGLVGNGSTKYLNSNRQNAADSQNSRHQSVFLSTGQSVNSTVAYIAGGGPGYTGIIRVQTTNNLVCYASNDVTGVTVSSQGNTTGLKGVARNNSSQISIRSGGVTTTASNTSAAENTTRNVAVFAQIYTSVDSYTDARIAFYSIGESLDLALLDARVTALINAFAAAIP
jgi:hypothetical protein